MDGLKPWQIILIVAAVIVFGVSMFFMFTGTEPEFGSGLYMVDVTSGEIYILDTTGKRGYVLPAKHPETGLRTLVPMEVGEDKQGRVATRYQSIVEQILVDNDAELSQNIDEQTWLVTAEISSAKKYVRP